MLLYRTAKVKRKEIIIGATIGLGTGLAGAALTRAVVRRKSQEAAHQIANHLRDFYQQAQEAGSLADINQEIRGSERTAKIVAEKLLAKEGSEWIEVKRPFDGILTLEERSSILEGVCLQRIIRVPQMGFRARLRSWTEAPYKYRLVGRNYVHSFLKLVSLFDSDGRPDS